MDERFSDKRRAMMLQRDRRGSSLLELEAAEYFKLEPDQMFFSSAGRLQKFEQQQKQQQKQQRKRSTKGFVDSANTSQAYQSAEAIKGPMSSRKAATSRTSHRYEQQQDQNARSCGDRLDSCGGPNRMSKSHALNKLAARERVVTAVRPERSQQDDDERRRVATMARAHDRGAQANEWACSRLSSSPSRTGLVSSLEPTHTVPIGSSTTSTNSLPSIASSPSVSPSLVCPHLSLDDILNCRPSSSGSPHTIGLCPKCRLDPPPNIHSPLSPLFRAHSRSPTATTITTCASEHKQQPQTLLQRRLKTPKDEKGPAVGSLAAATSATKAPPQMPQKTRRHKSDLSENRRLAHGDSLDYYLEPKELRRMQLPPTLRNSVEFIRRNSIESGRVVRIYKNGEPFEKPLRVCILRSEFATLDHLLDHINSRLLVPLGARYLFHLDGQLVYSMHELKHGSMYVVSGIRSYDYRTSEVLREQQRREQLAIGKTNVHNTTLKLASARQLPVQATSRSNGNYGGDGGSPTLQATQQRSENSSEQLAASSGSGTSRNKPADAASATANDFGPVSDLNATVGPKSKAAATPNRELRPPARQQGPGRQKGPAGRQSELSNTLSGHKPSTSFNDGIKSPSVQSIDEARVGEFAEIEQVATRLTRAKSELSALPSKKQKKNVTFMDTGRGSSPAISLTSSGSDATGKADATGSSAQEHPPVVLRGELDTIRRTNGEQARRQAFRELSTSEIGIQVSDSIDGFLIDLPVALPAKGDDSNLNASRRPVRARNTLRGGRKQASVGNRGRPPPPKQIVTISERQLSLDELNELRDLGAGNHHSEAAGLRIVSLEKVSTLEKGAVADSVDVLPDQTNTISIEDEASGDKENQLTSKKKLKGVGNDGQNQDPGDSAPADPESSCWQYPGGRAASATPTERPVSQSGPSESMRARVTTPTPSLSTCGDNNSLAMAYETILETDESKGLASEAKAAAVSGKRGRRPQVAGELPPKRRAEVQGTLYAGLEAPAKNFRLVWANGFAINDLYPANSVDVRRLVAAGGGDGEGAQSRPTSAGVLLSPRDPFQRTADGDFRSFNEFTPSERYSNWICHSRLHDELVHPAGCLVVLWCRRTDEQRFYSKHSSNVSCVTLARASARLELAASAQISVSDSLNRTSSGAGDVHLWSLTSLETLHVIRDDQFRGRLLFSLRLKCSVQLDCELAIAARDEKQLLLFNFCSRLTVAEREQAEEGGGSGAALENAPPKPPASSLIMRASKPLMANQTPLFVLWNPAPSESCPGPDLSDGKPSAQATDALISFGRRHFSVWSADPKQRKLRQIRTGGQQNGKLLEMIARANCLCRLAPGELLLGDSAGNVALLLVDYRAPVRQLAQKQVQPERRGPSATLGGLEGAGVDAKCSIVLVPLVEAPPLAQAPPASGRSLKRPDAISCLTRISGSLFVSADAHCVLRFWRIRRPTTSSKQPISCEQLSSISLPADLGFVCAVVLANYKLSESLVEFYVVSTGNTILFGAVKLPPSSRPAAAAQQRGATTLAADLLANSSLSVVYEGHETSAASLVADPSSPLVYFTCALDCRICKWNGKELVWKSMLPSACVSLAAHPIGSVLAVGSADGTVYILDKQSGLLVSYFPLTPVRVDCLAYSRDGSLLAAACANRSIFVLPVYEQGLKYKKVSIFQSPNAVVCLQFSVDNRYMLTSVTDGHFQELVLWDLPNFRYLRDNVRLVAARISWFDSICTGSDDVRAIWENANLSFGRVADVAGADESGGGTNYNNEKRTIRAAKQQRAVQPSRPGPNQPQLVVNLSCHRLVQQSGGDFVIASDTNGHLRLFRYPADDIQQAFYASRISSSAVNCCRFLRVVDGPEPTLNFVSTSIDGSVCLWQLD